MCKKCVDIKSCCTDFICILQYSNCFIKTIIYKNKFTVFGVDVWVTNRQILIQENTKIVFLHLKIKRC